MLSSKSVATARTIQSVIFDMDGVIIDSHPAHRRAWQAFLRTIGEDVSEHELDFILEGRKRRDILRHFLGNASEEEIAEYGRRKDHFFQQISLEVMPIPGVIEFILRLRQENISLAIATSASKTRTRSTLKRLRLSQHFDAIVTGDDVNEGKPDPAIYSFACTRLQSEPGNSVAVEDAVAGVRAAKGAGLKCIGVSDSRSENKLRIAGADHIIQNFVGLSPTHLWLLLDGNS